MTNIKKSLLLDKKKNAFCVLVCVYAVLIIRERASERERKRERRSQQSTRTMATGWNKDKKKFVTFLSRDGISDQISPLTHLIYAGDNLVGSVAKILVVSLTHSRARAKKKRRFPACTKVRTIKSANSSLLLMFSLHFLPRKRARERDVVINGRHRKTKMKRNGRARERERENV
jgi:hypothetical protein